MSRDVNQFTVTDAVKASFKDRSNPRLSFLLDKLVEHLHDYVRETNLTQAEWLASLNFLYDCGKISTPDRHEFILLSDVLGLSACVDLVNTKGGGTEISNLGPFYLADAPEKPLGADLAGTREGVCAVAADVVAIHPGLVRIHAGVHDAAESFDLEQIHGEGREDAAGRPAKAHVRIGGPAFPDLQDGPVFRFGSRGLAVPRERRTRIVSIRPGCADNNAKVLRPSFLPDRNGLASNLTADPFSRSREKVPAGG